MRKERANGNAGEYQSPEIEIISINTEGFFASSPVEIDDWRNGGSYDL